LTSCIKDVREWRLNAGSPLTEWSRGGGICGEERTRRSSNPISSPGPKGKARRRGITVRSPEKKGGGGRITENGESMLEASTPRKRKRKNDRK